MSRELCGKEVSGGGGGKWTCIKRAGHKGERHTYVSNEAIKKALRDIEAELT